MDTKQQQESVETGIALLERRHTQEFGAIAQRIDNATMVQAAVEHSARLRLEATQTPQLYFNTLSKVFSQNQFSAISINEFTWTKYPAKDIDRLLNELLGKRVQDPNDEDDGYYQEQYLDEDGEGSSITTLQQAAIKLSGKINRANHSYRDTVKLIGDFVTALEQLPAVEKVHVLHIPVDTRPEARFSDVSGLDQSGYIRDDTADFYEVLLVLKRGQHD
jgi:hypothetical protein